jgi:hypothetical protein
VSTNFLPPGIFLLLKFQSRQIKKRETFIFLLRLYSVAMLCQGSSGKVFLLSMILLLLPASVYKNSARFELRDM